MKKLMTILMMIVFAFVVSCGADNPAESNNNPDPTETADANAFRKEAQGKGNSDYRFDGKDAKTLSVKVGDVRKNLALVEAISATKALYSDEDSSRSVRAFTYMVLEIKGGKLYSTGSKTTKAEAMAAETASTGDFNDLSETTDAKDFADLVKNKVATKKGSGGSGMGSKDTLYMFNETGKNLSISTLSFTLIEAISSTKALYLGKMVGDVYMVLEVDGGSLKATALGSVISEEEALKDTTDTLGGLVEITFSNLVKGKTATGKTAGMTGGTVDLVIAFDNTDAKTFTYKMGTGDPSGPFNFVKDVSPTKALYKITNLMGPGSGDIFMLLEVTTGNKLKSTAIAGPGKPTEAEALVATLNEVGTLE